MIQTVNVNVAAQPTSGGPESFLVLSQNENGRQIRFRVLGDDLPAGCTATFSGTKPDGTVYSASGTIDGNFVLLDEEIQMTAVSGRWDAKLSIAKGTENIMTSLIRVTVVADAVSGDAIPSSSELDGIVAECRSYAEAAKNEAYGSPLTASTAAAMTDTGRVYVYTGSESGMTAGHWYYYNGTAWADGGVYNAVAVDTDTTLSIAGKAADAKKVGDELADVKEDFTNIAPAIIETVSGAMASFTDGADGLPMTISVNTTATSGTVTRTGKNVIPIIAKTATASEVTVTINDDGSLLINGTAEANNGVVLNENAQLKNYQSGTYALAVFGENTTGLSLQIMSNTAFLPSSANIVTIPDDSTRNYVRIRFASGTTFNNVVVYPMMVYGDTVPTEYEPYAGTTYPVTLTDGVVQEEINSLLGINNVWSDSGDVDVEYRADTKLYIDKRLGV